MKKIFWLSIFALIFIATPVYAKNPKGSADYNGLNRAKSEVIHLYLYEKDSEWEVVDFGAWGKMTINFKNNKFVFNGHELTPGVEYSLINYFDDWPGFGSVLLGTAMADEYGDIHISEMFEETISGKVWLVTSNHFDGEKMVGWSPSDYLFEYNLID